LQLAKITYIEASGIEHEVDVQPGLSVMQGAVSQSIAGVAAECGGSCACGTCKVYVDAAWREKTGEPSEMEEAMFDGQDDAADSGRRLACQITVSEDLHGLIVRIPNGQM
jgi:ferredoxin, 2Fe-2S